MSLAFAQAVDRFHPGARVAVVEDGGNIQAFLPYQLGSRAIGLPIGSPMNDLQGFIQSEVPINAGGWCRRRACGDGASGRRPRSSVR